MNSTLSGRIVVVTGASSGIGRAAAIECAESGAELVLCGRREEALLETAGRFPEKTKYRICPVDLTDHEAAAAKLKELLDAGGPVSGFVHSAGVRTSLPLRMTEPAEMLRDYCINAVSGFMVAKLLSSKKYVCREGASFVFIASAAAHRGAPSILSYCASKGAVVSGVRALAAELAPKKIRVNSVSPGFVMDTGITRNEFAAMPEEARMKIEQAHPLGLGTPADVAKSIVFLLSDAARWITGTDLRADGGYCI
ncbi:MAG: SDR family oxidoreductase [Lentisphaeria bacterium]|nr:SDR family oxidoreductase [Lentisphaeria bacterium]